MYLIYLIGVQQIMISDKGGRGGRGIKPLSLFGGEGAGFFFMDPSITGMLWLESLVPDPQVWKHFNLWLLVAASIGNSFRNCQLQPRQKGHKTPIFHAYIF